jgi:signal transduction histidine kinase
VHVADAHPSSQLQIERGEQYNLQMIYYPTEAFMAPIFTPLPIILACCGVLLILLVSLVFVGYDMAVRGQLVSNEILLDTVRGEAARKEIVLDTKRSFVRFVSHEIRTPMNAVRLGMTLFSTEIDGLVAKLAGKSVEEVMEVLHTTLTDWRQIAVDVLDNTVAAVDVLNDLLNYDKVSSTKTCYPLTLLH